MGREYEKIKRRYFRERRRNVLAKPGPFEMVVVLDQLKAGFNVPKIFRSAEAFGIHGVHLVNIGPFEPAPAKGAFRKVPARFYDAFAESHAELVRDGYTLFRMEPEADTPLTGMTLPSRSAFVLGHEEFGCSFTREEFPDVKPLTIPQIGGMQSLNVSVAASIVMYEYVRQHGGAGALGTL